MLPLVALALPALADDEAPIKIGATLELNYTFNGNAPGSDNTAVGYTAASGNRNGYYFNRKEGVIGLNMAELSLTKEATPKSRVGFAVRFVDGEVAKMLAANTETINAAARSRAVGNIVSSSVVNLYEASVRSLLTEKLTLDAGIFPTWVGYETIPTGTSSFFSKSFHFGQYQPFYHAGVKATYASDAKTSITGAVVNAYNGTDRSSVSRDLGLGFQVAHSMSESAKVYVNGLTARDVGLGGTKHDIFNVVYTNQLNEQNGVALDASYVTSGPSGGRTKSYGYTGYLTHTLGNGNVVGLRGEYLNEDRVGGNLLAFGGAKKPSLNSITASYELKNEALKGMRTLFEVRFDSANSAIFPTKTGAKKNQTTVSLAQIVSF
ncbi:MAG: outer membrane beta-barrel protein [Armatimonas sp.]